VNRGFRWVVAVLGLALAVDAASAKTFRYASGPKAQTDSMAIAEAEAELVVASRKRRQAPTNMSLLLLVAKDGIGKALQGAPLVAGAHVVLAPSGDHSLNFVAEYAMLRNLSDRKVAITVRRGPVPDDSMMVLAGNPGGMLLEYQLATARVTYLGLRGMLPGRTKVERQATFQATLTMRDPATGSVTWLGQADHNLIDLFPRSQQQLVEDPRYSELQTPVPQRAWQNLVEPAIVVAIVGGLVLLFFQNRP
jgi:hypothetical protein